MTKCGQRVVLSTKLTAGDVKVEVVQQQNGNVWATMEVSAAPERMPEICSQLQSRLIEATELLTTDDPSTTRMSPP